MPTFSSLPFVARGFAVSGFIVFGLRVHMDPWALPLSQASTLQRGLIATLLESQGAPLLLRFSHMIDVFLLSFGFFVWSLLAPAEVIVGLVAARLFASLGVSACWGT